ncbi:MAG TPA: hypothetical protein VEJ63_22590 [Planctomycetota bacterium]|nr:hypothetical protein [Planctomycetota bacterium]
MAEDLRLELYQIAVRPGSFKTLLAAVHRHVQAGVQKEVLYKVLEGIMLQLREEGREVEEDAVTDVLDYVVGWGKSFDNVKFDTP